MKPHYGENTQFVIREKTLNEHMNYWIDGVVDRYLRRKEMLETVYGINDDYSPPEENNIEYFDMLDEKAEEEQAKEDEEIMRKYLNENEQDDYDEDSYSNDYWKKR
jgi:GTP-binding protein EngB required for normal cell division